MPLCGFIRNSLQNAKDSVHFEKIILRRPMSAGDRLKAQIATTSRQRCRAVELSSLQSRILAMDGDLRIATEIIHD
jgi:hypothetical protein